MRPRKKKHADDRLAACGRIIIENPTEKKGQLKECFEYPEHPLHLELGCGKGKFITTLAAQNPNINYIAFEREKDVIVIAVELAFLQNLPNLRFVVDDATRLSDMFANGETERIYINFCDPWHKQRHAKRRLTYRENLNIYKNVLCESGEIHFKTDNQPLYHFSLWEFKTCMELIFQTEDLHHSPENKNNIMTEYEIHFSSLGMPIYAIWGRKNDHS